MVCMAKRFQPPKAVTFAPSSGDRVVSIDLRISCNPVTYSKSRSYLIKTCQDFTLISHTRQRRERASTRVCQDAIFPSYTVSA